MLTIKTYGAIFKKMIETFLQKIKRFCLAAWLIGGFFIFLLVGVTSFLLLRRDTPGELSLRFLEDSWVNEKTCHEDCLVRRNKERVAVIKSLSTESRESSQINKKIKKYLFQSGPNVSLEFQIELIKIIAAAYGQNNPPIYLREALINNKIETPLQVAMLNNFQMFINDQEARNFYLSILSSDRGLVIKKEAIRALSNLNGRTEEGKELMAETDFTPLENLLFDFNTPSSLRISVVMLLSDYYYLFPERSVEILTRVYETLEFDNFSRALAADALNHFSPVVSYDLPVISEDDWKKYYNN